MPLPKIFEKCCDRESLRYDLSTPWVHEGRIFATDGRILVWCDAAIHPKFKSETKPNKKRLNPDLVMRQTYEQPHAVRLPDALPLEECPHCGELTIEPDDDERILRDVPSPKNPLAIANKFVRILREAGISVVQCGDDAKTPVRFENPVESFSGFVMPLTDDR